MKSFSRDKKINKDRKKVTLKLVIRRTLYFLFLFIPNTFVCSFLHLVAFILKNIKFFLLIAFCFIGIFAINNNELIYLNYPTKGFKGDGVFILNTLLVFLYNLSIGFLNWIAEIFTFGEDNINSLEIIVGLYITICFELSNRYRESKDDLVIKNSEIYKIEIIDLYMFKPYKIINKLTITFLNIFLFVNYLACLTSYLSQSSFYKSCLFLICCLFFLLNNFLVFSKVNFNLKKRYVKLIYREILKNDISIFYHPNSLYCMTLRLLTIIILKLKKKNIKKTNIENYIRLYFYKPKLKRILSKFNEIEINKLKALFPENGADVSRNYIDRVLFYRDLRKLIIAYKHIYY